MATELLKRRPERPKIAAKTRSGFRQPGSPYSIGAEFTTYTLLRIATLCVMLAGAETLHGIARTVLVVPRIGKDRATKLSVLATTEN